MLKNIKQKLTWKAIEEDLTTLVHRFPLSVVALLVLFGITTILTHAGYNNNDLELLILAKSAITAIFVALLSYALVLGIESWNIQSKATLVVLYTMTLVAGLLYYVHLPSSFDSLPFESVFILLAILVLVCIASFSARFERQYFKKEYQEESFFHFVLVQLSAILQGLFVAIFVFLLGAATLGSLDALFNLSVDGEWYMQWWLVAATLMGPFYFLSHIPQGVTFSKDYMRDFDKFLRFMVMYIALPFIAIYFVILYAYSIQVLVDFSNWPEGIVSWLVIFFSFFGWVIYFLSYDSRKEKVVALFRKWFPLVLAPQLGMLFYAIGLRIAQHGVTINRYLVVLFGLWILFLCVYYIFSKQKALFVLPTSLFLGLVMSLIGPWGIFAVSQNSQLEKIETHFAVHNISTQQGVRELSATEAQEISEEDTRSIVSGIRYLCEYHGCDVLSDLYGEDYPEAVQEDTYYYNRSRELIEYIGLSLNISDVASGVRFISFYSDGDNTLRDISQYSKYSQVNSYGRDDSPISISLENNLVVISGPTFSLDITQEVSQYIEANQDLFSRGETSGVPPLVFAGGVLFLQNVSAESKSGEYEIMNMSGDVFLK